LSFIGGGTSHTLQGVNSAAIGGTFGDTSALGDQAVILGGQYNWATKNSTVVMGICAYANHPTSLVMSGNSQTASDAQRGKSQGILAHLDQRTTDDTPLTMDSAGTQLVLLTNMMWSVTGKVAVWNETDTTATDWDIDFLVYEAGAALTFVAGSGAQTIANTDDAGVPVLSIGSTGTTINFTVTGIAAKNMRWTAFLRIAQAVT